MKLVQTMHAVIPRFNYSEYNKVYPALYLSVQKNEAKTSKTINLAHERVGYAGLLLLTIPYIMIILTSVDKFSCVSQVV